MRDVGFHENISGDLESEALIEWSSLCLRMDKNRFSALFLRLCDSLLEDELAVTFAALGSKHPTDNPFVYMCSGEEACVGDYLTTFEDRKMDRIVVDVIHVLVVNVLLHIKN